MNTAKNSALASTWISFRPSSSSTTSMAKYCRSQALRNPRAPDALSSSRVSLSPKSALALGAPSPRSPRDNLAAFSASLAASSMVSLIHATTPNMLSTTPNPRSSHKNATSSLATVACATTPIVANPSTFTGASSIAARRVSMSPRASRLRRSSLRRTASLRARFTSSPRVALESPRVEPPNAFFVPNLFADAAADVDDDGFAGDNRAIARCRSASLANRESRDVIGSPPSSPLFEDAFARTTRSRIVALDDDAMRGS
mmetsp:Transcript_1178/g.2549  ORF Transcript_1178/g.2549 Transcript_1178/m.2549 type:complete len:258 (+) Transcript_1178:208-981(+)